VLGNKKLYTESGDYLLLWIVPVQAPMPEKSTYHLPRNRRAFLSIWKDTIEGSYSKKTAKNKKKKK